MSPRSIERCSLRVLELRSLRLKSRRSCHRVIVAPLPAYPGLKLSDADLDAQYDTSCGAAKSEKKVGDTESHVVGRSAAVQSQSGLAN